MSAFSEYDDYDGVGLAQLVAEGQVEAGEILAEAIERCERLNPDLNAVSYRYYDAAREAVAAGLPPGPFQGVPFLLKDLHLSMRNTVCSNGSAMWRDNTATHDSTLVSRYRDAGLVIFGRTNSPELGLNPVTEPEAFGPSCNPWDLSRTPGGSSGGAGAAVAAGILPVAHASDGGGSIRIPASCCGLVGLKPSRGRTPFGPDLSEGWAGQSTNHVVSRTVRDTAVMLDATAGPEPGDAYSAPHQSGRFADALQAPPAELRIAVSREKWGPGAFSAEVLASLDRTVDLLQCLGHTVVEARPDYDAEAAATAQYAIVCANVACTINQRAEALNVDADALPMEDGTRFIFEIGKAGAAADYVAAVQFQQQLGRDMGRFLEDYDVLLAPTLASEPIAVGALTGTGEDYADNLFAYLGDTGVYNLTGQPSLSLPLCWSEAGLPLGMMFSAAYGDDALLLQLAGQLEQARPWAHRRPPLHASIAC